MQLTGAELGVLAFMALYVPAFTWVALRRSNYEFLLYVLVIIALTALVAWRQSRVHIPPALLLALAVWGLMHMAGGLVPVGDTVLYGVVLVDLWPRFSVLRYDQLVHFYGFGVATLVACHLLAPHLAATPRRGFGFWMLIALMGCGLGAINEMVEFVAVVLLPSTGVGGYENTMLDLVFNCFGATVAVVWLSCRERRKDGTRAR